MLNLKKFKEKLFLKRIERDAKNTYKILPSSPSDINKYRVAEWTEYGFDTYGSYDGLTLKDALDILAKVRTEYINRKIDIRSYNSRVDELKKY